MPMSITEFRQLKKLLTLATSDNDGEALSAWRAATRLLVSTGHTWEMAMDRVIKIVQEFDPVPDPTFDGRVIPGRTPEQQNGGDLEPLFEWRYSDGRHR